jgi:hypothetical protein
VALIHNGILFSHKGWNLVICSNIAGTSNHYVERNEPGTERQVTTWSHSCWLEKVDLLEVENRMVVTRGQGEKGRGRNAERLINGYY